jgi:hypothetical protein
MYNHETPAPPRPPIDANRIVFFILVIVINHESGVLNRCIHDAGENLLDLTCDIFEACLRQHF